jgi:glucose/arabinose dehydrogenase
MSRTVAALACLALVATVPALTGAADASSSSTPRASQAEAAAAPQVAGFQDRLSIGSITEPTAVAFAPDGTAFVALKPGRIKSFDYDGTNRVFEPNAASTEFADLTTNVMNYWDRGLTGIAVDPLFGTAGHNFVYVNYTYNRDPRDPSQTVPRWGDPSLDYDDCASPASVDPVVVGCPAMARVSRLTAEKLPGGQGWTMKPGSELELLAAGCFQFPSHASGDVRIGPADGLLYASFGDGASFTTEDWGQAGNPCGDPLDEGGSLRAQDARTTTDPLDVDGAIVRMNPATGLAPTAIASGLVAYGQRNPWRFAFRDGQPSQLWSSDVGGSLAEEVNRVTVSSGMTAVNRGWPCYEGSWPGSVRNPAWDGLDKPICEQLYAAGAVQAPAFSYSHLPEALPGEACEASTSATSGVAFAPSAGNYPAGSTGAMFFADFARGCVWQVGLTSGEPDPSKVTPFITGAGAPVDLTTGPNGDLFYVDYGLDEGGTPTENAGGVHRVEYRLGNQAPVAVPVATNTSGPNNPITVMFSGAGSTDADSGPLTYAWDLDGDGSFDDGTGVSQQRTYSSATGVWVSLRVSAGGLIDQRSIFVRITPGNSAPSITSMSPSDTALWSVGQDLAFSATAADDAGALPDSAYTWQVSIRHCPGGGTGCHTHPLQTYSQTRSGVFEAPDHEWISTLILKVTVTDSAGLTSTRTVELQPQPSLVRFRSSPPAVPLTIAGGVRTPPYEQTFIAGSAFQVVAPQEAVLDGVPWLFSSWSDGGDRSHTVVAGAQTLTASYRPADPDDVRAELRVLTRRSGLHVRVDGRRHRAPFARAYSWGRSVHLVAPKRQVRHGAVYRFVRWSDGKGRKHAVLLTGEPLTLKAVYRRQA